MLKNYIPLVSLDTSDLSYTTYCDGCIHTDTLKETNTRNLFLVLLTLNKMAAAARILLNIDEVKRFVNIETYTERKLPKHNKPV